MEQVLPYILKASAVLAAFYLLWRFTLRKKAFHAESRIYLLAAMAVSFVLPLLVITFTKTVEVPQVGIAAEEPSIAGTLTASGNGYPVMAILPFIYFAGVLAVLVYNLFSLAGVYRIISSSEDAVLSDGTRVKVCKDLKVPFSFFSVMVVPGKDMPNPDRALILHEKAHVSYGHSTDVQLCALVCALQWFNPFIWMLREDLRCVHEFQADAAVLKSGVGRTDYQIFLVEEVLSSGGYNLANNLTSGNLKSRIDMMNSTISSRRPLARFLLAIPLAAVCLLANSKTAVVYTSTSPEEQIPPQTQNIGSVPFQEVEVKPTFGGSDVNEFSKWVSLHLTYPEEAKKARIQGRVTVTFTVDKDGSVKNVSVLRGVNKLLDDEAVRVVSSSPKWTPGKSKGENVPVTYTFPVIFAMRGEPASNYDLPKSLDDVIVKAQEGDPIIFIDGKEYKGLLKDVDLESIESVSVLKDKAATAAYGEKGANGVIVITTKGNKNKFSSANPGGSVPFQEVDEKPTFNGGDANEFSKWVASQLQYPAEAKAAKVQGRVTLQYTVTEDGSVKDVAVLRGINEQLDAEAVRVVSSSPKWNPGKRDGKPVPVTYTFPVIFRLD